MIELYKRIYVDLYMCNAQMYINTDVIKERKIHFSAPDNRRIEWEICSVVFRPFDRKLWSNTFFTLRRIWYTHTTNTYIYIFRSASRFFCCELYETRSIFIFCVFKISWCCVLIYMCIDLNIFACIFRYTLCILILILIIC